MSIIMICRNVIKVIHTVGLMTVEYIRSKKSFNGVLMSVLIVSLPSLCRNSNACMSSTAVMCLPLFLSFQQLSMLPLMEPMIGVNFAYFPPYGSGQLNGESRLSGSFGSASLDGVSDYYSQLIYKVKSISSTSHCSVNVVNSQHLLEKMKLFQTVLMEFFCVCSRTILAIPQHRLLHCLPHRPLWQDRSY